MSLKPVKAIAVIICVLVIIAIFFTSRNGGHRFTSTSLFPTPVPEKTSYTFLLLGYGGPNHDGPYLTDTMMAIHIDTVQKKVILISVPRDIWYPVPTKSKQPFGSKINALYSITRDPKSYPDVDLSPPNTFGKTLVEQGVASIIGKPIDGYFGVDFSAFTTFIDSIGGIDVHVDKTFTDPEYPIDGNEDLPCGHTDTEIKDYIATSPSELDYPSFFPCRYETLHFDAGLQHMDGATALKFARSRHSIQDGTDFGRASRQQKVLEAVRDKVLSIGFITKIPTVLEQLKNHTDTNITFSDIQKMLGQAPFAGQYHITTIVISDSNYLKSSYSADGQYILIPKEGPNQWGSLQHDIDNSISGITPTPSPTITPTIHPTSVLPSP